MLYVQRNKHGDITGLTLEPDGDNAEPANLSSPDVRAFLQDSDMDMIRVIEDLVDLLIDKGLIRADELPESAQLKLLYRKNTRTYLAEDNEVHG